MKYSYVIPVYNRLDEVKQLVSKLISFNRDDFEIIIIDDGSSNNHILENMVSEINNARVLYFYQPNQGVSVARNRGAELSKGQYLIFFDSDDFVYDMQLNIFDDMIKHYSDCDVVFSSYEFWNSITGEIKARPNLSSAPKYTTFFDDFIHGIQPFLVGGGCIKASTFRKTKGFPTSHSFGEDQSFWIDLICDYKVYSINKVTHRYKVDSVNSLSKQKLTDLPHDMYNVIERFEERKSFINNDFLKARKYLLYRIFSFLKIALKTVNFRIMYKLILVYLRLLKV